MSSQGFMIEILKGDDKQVLGPLRLRFEDLVHICCWQREDMVLEIFSGSKRGYLYFESGELVHAVAAGYLGKEAFYLIRLWDDARFGIQPLERPVMRSITKNVNELLQEGQGICAK